MERDVCCETKTDCDTVSPYRTLDGFCNNVHHPYWGVAGSAYQRLLDAEYEDEEGVPRGGWVDTRLPNAREVSTSIHHSRSSAPLHHKKLTLMVMQFGQLLDHDISLAPESSVEECCSNSEKSDDCFPIALPSEDNFYSKPEVSQTCMEFTRTLKFCPGILHGLKSYIKHGKREQLNAISSFIDGSMVYGGDNELAAQLRTLVLGQLKIDPLFTKHALLPRDQVGLLAGDIRAAEQPGLAAAHTLLVREHNRLAHQIAGAHPGMPDEEIYQRARRYCIAEWQNIVYGNYLPIVLGRKAMAIYEMQLPAPGEWSYYKPDVNPSILNSFSTAAYRFGHSLIEGLVNVANSSDPKSVLRSYKLRENFFNVSQYLSEEGAGADRLLAGMIGQSGQQMDRMVVEDVSNFLFQERPKKFGMDLAARGIQRGRDHGLPPYAKYRELCGVPGLFDPESWSICPPEFEFQTWNILAGLYKKPEDIDLFTGGMAEKPVSDGVTGPTFNCIMAKQFANLMQGDRFFFTHKDQFTARELRIIRERSLRDLLCDTTSISEIQDNPFLQDDHLRSCEDRKLMNYCDMVDCHVGWSSRIFG